MDEAKPIKLTNLSAYDFSSTLAKKITALVSKLPPDWEISAREFEKSKEGLVRPKPPIVNKLQPTCKIFLLYIDGVSEKEMKNVDLLNIMPNFSKIGIDFPEDKIEWEDINKNWGGFGGSENKKFREFTWTFQTELLLEAIPIIFKRLRENNLLVMKAYLTSEMMALQIATSVEKSAHHPSHGDTKYTYDEIEKEWEKEIIDRAQSMHEKAIKMSLNEFRRFIIRNAIDPTVKKEPKKK